tara:strand:+ start:2090 stop:2503 length:414 start_codon:yes stop_codon:yes gene_type:complete
MTKECGRCKKELSEDQFSKNKNRKCGLTYECRKCRSDYFQTNVKHTTTKKIANALARGVLITEEEYEDKKIAQSFKCAICGMHESSLSKSLAIDHDHATNTFRGLLCQECNLGLGKFKDNAENLIRAAEYIRQNQQS